MQLIVKSALTEVETADPISVDLRKDALPYADVKLRNFDFGTIVQQSYENNYVNICNCVADLKKKATVYLHWPYPSIVLQFTLLGAIKCKRKGQRGVVLQEGNAVLFYHPKGQNSGMLTLGRCHSLHFELKADLVIELTQAIPQLSQFLVLANNNYKSAIQLPAIPINFAMRNSLKKLMNISYRNTALDFEVHTYIRQLISEYRDRQLEMVAIQECRPTPKIKTIIAIHDDILRHPTLHSNTVAQFAKKYFMNPKSIRRHFFSVYKINIGHFTTLQIMQCAMLLLQDSSKTVPDIAFELGYSSTFCFTRTFKQVYGMGPQRIRNEKQFQQPTPKAQK